MAGTHTAATTRNKGGRLIITTTWVGDAADGSVPDLVLQELHGSLEMVVTNPGTPAPTALYDVAIADADGADVLGLEGADRSATLSEQITPKIGSAYGGRRVDSTLTVSVANNAVVSATGTITLYLKMKD